MQQHVIERTKIFESNQYPLQQVRTHGKPAYRLDAKLYNRYRLATGFLAICTRAGIFMNNLCTIFFSEEHLSLY